MSIYVAWVVWVRERQREYENEGKSDINKIMLQKPYIQCTVWPVQVTPACADAAQMLCHSHLSFLYFWDNDVIDDRAGACTRRLTQVARLYQALEATRTICLSASIGLWQPRRCEPCCGWHHYCTTITFSHLKEKLMVSPTCLIGFHFDYNVLMVWKRVCLWGLRMRIFYQ